MSMCLVYILAEHYVLVEILLTNTTKTAHLSTCSNFTSYLHHVILHHVPFSAVDCYHNRIAKRFDFGPQRKIYNSMEIAVEYIVNHINFVHSKLGDIDADHNAVAIFQVDLCLVTGPTRSESNDVEQWQYDEDDGDVIGYDDGGDDDDEKGNDPGDIGVGLKGMGIPYCFVKHGDGNHEDNHIVSRLAMHRHGFVKLSGDSDKAIGSHSFIYQKRVVLTADLRDIQGMDPGQREGEHAWMYLPGGNGPIIPLNPVPEWGVASTLNMIVPGIGANMDCGGSLLTLSVQVWQKDVVKAYLFWNGKVMRFMPEDIRTVLPIIFNMDYPGNREFAESDEAMNAYVERIRDTLIDVEFDRFRNDK